uniref:HTH OST-type domain-containing protein n=1 Tax=Cuerna arida TaxID=1464854 RepID=A0A1B6GMF5_9HEMI
MESAGELNFILRGLLISNPKVTTAHRLQADFFKTEGKHFPYRQLGFLSFLDYLRSIPSVVQLVPFDSENPDVLPVVTKASSHIDKLVSKQKTTAPKKSSSTFYSRRGGYNGRPKPLPRRRPPCGMPSALPKTLPKKGVYVSDIEEHIQKNYTREDLTKHGIHSGKDVLSHAKDLVTVKEEKVFPKMSESPDISYSDTVDDYNLVGNENDYGDFELDFNNEEMWESVPEEVLSNYTIKHCFDSKFDPQRRQIERHDETLQEPEIDCNISDAMIRNFRTILEKHPHGIWLTDLPQLYKEEFKVSLDFVDLGYSSAITMLSFLPHVFTLKRIEGDWKLYDARIVEPSLPDHKECVFSGEFDSNERYIPQSILENVKELVEIKYPGGFRSTELICLYEKCFKKSLDLKALNIKRIEDFLEILKDVITVRKVTDFYLLLPKHKTMPLEAARTDSADEVLRIPSDSISVFVPENVLKPNQTILSQDLPEPKMDCACNEPLMEIEVRLGEVISPSMFYVMLDSTFNDLQIMMDDLDKFYKLEQDLYQIPLPSITLNLYCACEYEGSWHRAKVTGFKANNLIEIEYIDYGTPAIVKRSDLRYLQNEFAKLPAQAICAKLVGIQPINGGRKWPTEVCVEFLHLVSDRRLFAEVYSVSHVISKDRIQLEVILHDTERTNEFNFNDYFVLVKKSAIYIHDHKGQNHSEEKLHKEKEYLPQVVSQNMPKPDQVNPVKRRPPPGFESFVPSESIDSVGSSSQCSYPTNISSHTTNPASGYNIQPSHMQINNFHSSFYVTPQMFHEQNFSYANQNSLYSEWPHNNINHPPALPSIPNSSISSYSTFMFPYQANSSHHNVNTFSKQTNVISQTLINPILEESYNRLNSRQKDSSDYCEKSYIPGNYPELNNGLNLSQALPQQKMSNSFSSFCHPHPQQRYNSGLSLSQTLPHGVSRGFPLLPLLPQQGFTNNQGLSLSQPLVTQHNFNNLCLPVAHSSLPKQNTRPQSSPVIPPTEKEIHVKSSLSAEVSNISIDDVSKNQGSELKETSVKLPSFVKVENVWNNIQGVMNSGRSHVQGIKEGFVNSLISNKTLSKSNNFHNSINLEVSNNLEQKNVLRHSAEYTSSKVKDCKITNSETLNFLSKKQSADIDNLSNENIPDSWEDILSDDIPAKADNFIDDFKKPLDLVVNENCTFKTIQNDDSLLENVVENNLLSTIPSRTPVNWKDMFDPDSVNVTRDNRNIKNEIRSKIDKEGMKKTLVQKIEIDNRFFHLILVKKKLAIMCKEFFHQYTNIYFHVIDKLMELKDKPFPCVKKAEEPELFSKLAQVDFCGGVEKGVMLKLNKISITYLSDIPEILSILKIDNKVLLDELKKISKHFDS